MKNLIHILQDAAFFQDVRRRMSQGAGARLEGVWGSALSYLLAALGLAEDRVILCILPQIEQAEAAAEDLNVFAPGLASYLPAWDELDEHDPPDVDVFSQRLALAHQLFERREAGRRRVVVTPVQAVLQEMATPEALAEDTLEIRRGDTRPPQALAEWLTARGFRQEPMVEAPGQFSRRGGILDAFPHAAETPVRIEFFGDQVDSIRPFDLDTQVSTGTVQACRLVAAQRGRPARTRQTAASVLRYLPEGSWLAIREPAEVLSRAEELGVEWGQGAGEAGRREIQDAMARLPTLQVAAVPGSLGLDAADLGVRSTERFGGGIENAVAEMDDLTRKRRRVVVFCHNEAERQRLGEMLAGSEIPGRPSFAMRLGPLNHGFDWPDLGVAAVPHHEIFHRYRQRRERPRFHPTRAVDAFTDLRLGDHVVHATHGIGVFRGLELLATESGEKRECICIEYAGRARLYVPATRIELVQKYVGPSEARPPLSRLGSRTWARKKERALAACQDLAAELLRLDAIRESLPGVAHPPDNEWQRAFEQAFIYQETEDQLTVAADIKRDLESPRPMDRLVCGDVGYGKTELAMRAAFKAVMGGRQVAVLVPTTVLAMQHQETFSERMRDYPVIVEMLSRFRTPAEQTDVVRRLATGQVDIVIGTHRLLQKDVQFRDLGLVIIDEEQRFGVAHKEGLKRLRETVDVLTLTATPIPRTLHMAILGLRDISTLETPPAERLPIQTRLWRYDPQRVRQALLRELARDGQVFFVHNRVDSIRAVADELRRLVPEARIVVGHGQMPERELQEVMRSFVNREADVLVCTTIIESGVDIPNANTILINNADMFGLAEMHQLRGRVGRYKHRAYAYLLLPPRRPVSPVAEKRLKALEEFADLGAGFRIALRDLEIRGAGNILGPEQSGHIAAVGYDMYCRLLETAVRKQRNEEVPRENEVSLALAAEAFLPEGYVADPAQRIDIYRRLHRARSCVDVDAVREELRDRFGTPPAEAETLIETCRLQVLCQAAGIRSISRNGRDLTIQVENMAAAGRALAPAGPRLRVLDEHTLYLRLESARIPPVLVLRYLTRVLTGAKEHNP